MNNSQAIIVWGTLFFITVCIVILGGLIASSRKTKEKTYKEKRKWKINIRPYYKIINDEMTNKHTKAKCYYFIWNTLYLTKFRIVQGYYSHNDKVTFKIEFKYFFRWIEYTDEIYEIEVAKEVLTIIEDVIKEYYSKKYAYTKNKKIIEVLNENSI